MYRQGDVLLVPGARTPYGSRVILRREQQIKDKGLVLAAGEATGHHHVVKEPKARLLRDNAGRLILQVPKKGAKLTHEEHTAIELPAGKYRVVRQREYVPPTTTQRATTQRVWD